MIRTRAAAAADADDVARLTGQLGYRVEPGLVATRLQRILARPDQILLVADDDGSVVGWIHGTRVEYLEADPFVVVAGLVVDRARRGQGIGRLLLAEVESWGRKEGCSIVRLWSSAARTAAHRFYQRAGYENIKTQYSFAKSVDPSGGTGFEAFVPDIPAGG